MLACIFAPRPVKQPIRFGDGVHTYTKPDSSLFILFLPPMLNDKGQIKYIVTYYSSFRFLPPATKLEQGYIFIGVCDSVHGGGCYPSMHCWWYPSMPCSRSAVGGGSAPRGGLLLGVCSWKGLVETPQDGHCWNAFLLVLISQLSKYQTTHNYWIF